MKGDPSGFLKSVTERAGTLSKTNQLAPGRATRRQAVATCRQTVEVATCRQTVATCRQTVEAFLAPSTIKLPS